MEMDIGIGAVARAGRTAGHDDLCPALCARMGGRWCSRLEQGGNTDIYAMDSGSGAASRLTSAPSIETAPSYSPDGSQIVFESDRSGTQQIYIMSAGGGEPVRISNGAGRYGTPGLVAARRPDRLHQAASGPVPHRRDAHRRVGRAAADRLASWTKARPGHRTGGSSCSPGRAPGRAGEPALYSVDISGRNLRKVPTEGPASDPAWSPLLP